MKNRNVVYSSFAVMFLSLSYSVFAAPNWMRVIAPVASFFDAVFYQLPNNPQYAPALMKFMLWIGLVSIYLIAVRATPWWKDNEAAKKYATNIGMDFSFIGIMAMPEKTVVGLWTSLSILAILAYIIAVVRFFTTISETKSTVGGTMGMFLAGLVTIILAEWLLSTPPYTDPIAFGMSIYDMVSIAGFGIMLYAIWKGVSGIAKGNSEAHPHADSAHPATPGASPTPGLPEDGETPEALKNAIEQLVELVEEFNTHLVDPFNTQVGHLMTSLGTGATPGLGPGSLAPGEKSDIISKSDAIVTEIRAINSRVQSIVNSPDASKIKNEEREALHTAIDGYLHHIDVFNTALVTIADQF